MNYSFETAGQKDEYIVPTGVKAIAAVQAFEADVDDAKAAQAATELEAVDSLDTLMNDQLARTAWAERLASARSHTAFSERMLGAVKTEAAQGKAVLGSLVLQLV